MKQNLLKGILCFAAAAAFTACTDGIGTGFESSDAKGKIALTTSIDCSVENSRSRVEYNEVIADSLSLKLTSADGSFTRTWNRLSDFSTDQLFAVGTYTLEAFYGSSDSEGLESPYFHGSTTVRVEEDKTSQVAVTATLANALLDITYTDDFLSYMTSHSTQVHSAGGKYFDVESTKPVYTKAGEVEIFVKFTKPNGQTANLSAASFTAEPKHFYHVTIDVTNKGGSGSASLEITLSDGLAEETIDIDISDDILNAPAPTVTPDGFVSGETIEVVGGTGPEKAVVNVIAQGGLKKVVLTTSSTSLAAQGWPAEVDLIGADLAPLRSLGLDAVGVTKPDKMAVIDLTGVVSHIYYVNGDEKDNKSTLTLLVYDNNGKVSEPVTLSVATTPLTLGLSDGVYYIGDTSLSFTLTYNGNDPENDVTVQYKNTRGTYTTLYPAYESAGAKGVYTATADFAPTNADIQLVAKANGVDPVYLTITPVYPDVVYDDTFGANAFAKSVIIPAAVGNGNVDPAYMAMILANADVYVSKDNASFNKVAAESAGGEFAYMVKDLEPDTKYYGKIVNKNQTGEPVVFSFETESVAQLPDAGFDSWTFEKKGDYQYLWRIGDNTVWSSMNELTLSQSGSGSGNGLSTGGCAYKATSGTIPANSRTNYTSGDGGLFGTTKRADGNTTGDASLHNNKQASGENAALIRTVGWGSGNTANMSGSFATCKNITVGELFLGSYNNGAQYGYEFNSRPSGISFQYHYDVVTPGNGDFGTAEITVYDNMGEVIATGSKNLVEKSNYVKETVELNYTVLSKKASKISVIFKSSGIESDIHEENKNTTWFRVPGRNNTSGGEYVGSELYIDDIVLNY